MAIWSLCRIELQLVTVWLILSYDWLEFRVAADSIIQLTRVLVAGNELRLILSHSWLEFQRLDRSCGWFHHNSWFEFQRVNASCGWFHTMAISSSGSWIRAMTDSILWLATSCGRFCPAADSRSADWIRLAADLYFNIFNKFKDLFCKIHHFYSLFSIGWF